MDMAVPRTLISGIVMISYLAGFSVAYPYNNNNDFPNKYMNEVDLDVDGISKLYHLAAMFEESGRDFDDVGVEETELKGLVDSIILAFINNIKKFLQEHEPVTIPQLPTTTIEDDNVSVKLTLKNLEIYKTSSFKVNKIQNSIFHMTEAFNMTFPEMEYHAQYELSGTVLGRNVKGKGKVRVYMTNLVTWGKAYATLKRGKVQLKKLNIDYTLEKITAKATGLKVSGKSDAEVEELLNSQLLAYFTKNERVVCDTISNLVVEHMNEILGSMGISEVLNWLLHYRPGH